MADFNSALPVRTITNGDVAVKVVDSTTVSQGLGVDVSGRVTIKLDDGSGNVITSQTNGTQRALDVGIDVAGVQVDPRAIRALTAADIVTAQQGTSPWVTKDSANGAVAPGTAAGFSELAGGQYNSAGVTLTTGQQAALQLDSAGNLKVDLATAIPAGSNLIGAVNLDVGGSAVSNTNPVPVTITSSSPGTAVQNFTDLASIAVAGNATATYTVAASHTFNLERVFISSEARIKAVVQAAGSTIFTAFNSSANPNIDITVVAPPTIAAASTVTVQVFNLDLGVSDAYVTIEGNQN